MKHLLTTGKHTFKLLSFPPQSPIPASQLAIANKVFAKPAQFVQSISRADQAPATLLPEVAFVGRSNVGKSTLIKHLVNNHRLVKTSNSPGHTRTLNFFDVGGKLTLVDMPGYGFRSQKEWGELIFDYLTTRKQLKRLFLLIDPVAGVKSTDEDLMALLDIRAIPYQVILTKRDKLRTDAFEKAKTTIEQYLVENAMCCYPQLLSTSKLRKSQDNGAAVTDELARVRWAILNASGQV